MLQPAAANFRYDLAGEDLYRIESPSTVSRVSYVGTEQLSIAGTGKSRRFEARARYVRTAPDGKSNADARFVAELLPDGTFEDRLDDDPEFLTILNQPFAIQLDKATLRDLRELRGAVPFTAGSPLGGAAMLRGFLRPGTSGPLAGRPSIGVRFEAAGPMSGSLPGHGDSVLSGSMRMDGTAYYSLADAVLLALQATLTINARLRQNRSSAYVPVRITYRRSIRIADGERAVGQAPRRL